MFHGLTLEENSSPAAQCFRTRQLRDNWQHFSLHNAALRRVSSHASILHLPPSPSLWLNMLSLCHLPSRRSSLSHIQACTATCFRIGNTWVKGRNLLLFCIPYPRAELFSELEKIHPSNISETLSHVFASRFSRPNSNAHFVIAPERQRVLKKKFHFIQPFSKWSSDNLLKPMTPIRVFIPFAAQFHCSMAH